MVDAVDTLTTDKSIELFGKFGIFTKSELEATAEVLYEMYEKTINIEALTMIDMASKQIIPAVTKYTKSLADTVIAVREAGADASVQSQLLNETTELLKETKTAFDKLVEVQKIAAAMHAGKEQAYYYKDTVKVAMDELRSPVDRLEMIVDKDIWPMPSYGDLMFEV